MVIIYVTKYIYIKKYSLWPNIYVLLYNLVWSKHLWCKNFCQKIFNSNFLWHNIYKWIIYDITIFVLKYVSKDEI